MCIRDSLPSFFYTYGTLLLNMALYTILTWYFDHILSHNRGTADSAYFFLTPRYWKRVFGKHVHHVEPHHNSPLNTNSAEPEDETVTAEKNKANQLDESGVEAVGMRILGLGKSYTRYPFGIKSRNDVHALKEVFLESEEGELLSILGHNGAGKTTLIGVLTGLFPPSKGKAYVCGYNITEDMEDLRKVMGVCPQHDILWNDLTAAEHLRLFAKLKGFRDHAIEHEVDKRLAYVNLQDVKNALAGTFSGGMKRRLSIAISSIGDPKIIFLDEPTTGMDPKSRRHVWDLIQDLKKNRLIVLTTHAMEEADALSDRIMVMVDGRMKCIGTPLYLKNTHGSGYRLSLVTETKDIEEVKALILMCIPPAKLLDQRAGSLIVGVPTTCLTELNEFFELMEGKPKDQEWTRLKELVKDWGLSNTTLEEVFMEVTRKSKKMF
eukprot:TRINITY_DN10565_c0_g1_i1.p1 TRINITY_DN10565_c0_g1~~TRINITY_DN10565_c0_g1_i1.p1  ORF type:complete len:454 (+),score=146.91 TRINITY_DN10565_c0_g1_i1:59-1363(+)